MPEDLVAVGETPAASDVRDESPDFQCPHVGLDLPKALAEVVG
jgi:hypothetical protein